MVNKNFAVWRAVQCKSSRGGQVALTWAFMIDKAYKGTLLCRILEMSKKQPLSYETAISIFSDRMFEALNAKDYGVKPGQSGWYPSHFVEYISDLGFHIELSGDEIESFPVFEVRA